MLLHITLYIDNLNLPEIQPSEKSVRLNFK